MAIGLSCGIGFWWGALTTTVLVLFCLIAVKAFEGKVFKAHHKQGLYLRIVDSDHALDDVLNLLKKHEIQLLGYKTGFDWKDADPDPTDDILVPPIKLQTIDLVIRTEIDCVTLLQYVRTLVGIEGIETEQVLNSDGKPLLPTRKAYVPIQAPPTQTQITRAVNAVMKDQSRRSMMPGSAQIANAAAAANAATSEAKTPSNNGAGFARAPLLTLPMSSSSEIAASPSSISHSSEAVELVTPHPAISVTIGPTVHSSQ